MFLCVCVCLSRESAFLFSENAHSFWSPGEADLPGDSVECAEDELLSALRCFRQPVRTNRYGEVIRPTAGPPTTLRMNPRVLFSLAPDRSCTGGGPTVRIVFAVPLPQRGYEGEFMSRYCFGFRSTSVSRARSHGSCDSFVPECLQHPGHC